MFSIPFNNDYANYINKVVIPNKAYISEVYFSLPLYGSARMTHGSMDMKVYEKLCRDLIDLDIAPVVALNSNWVPVEYYDDEYFENLNPLLAFYGIKKVTVKNAYHTKMDALRNYMPDIKLEASINCLYDTIQKVVQALDIFGYDEIVLDRSFNTRLDDIKELSCMYRPRIKFKLLVNEGCLPNCPFKVDHDNLTASYTCYTKEYAAYLSKINPIPGNPIHDLNYNYGCGSVFKEFPEKVLQSPIILPSMVDNYVDYIDYIKIAGRTLPTEAIKSRLEDYIARHDPQDILSLTDNAAGYNLKVSDTIKRLYSYKLNCASTCYKCNVCKECSKELTYIDG